MGQSDRDRQLPGGMTAETPSTYAALCTGGKEVQHRTGTGETSYAMHCSCPLGDPGKAVSLLSALVFPLVKC